jgi:hypothetical protein
VTQVRSEFPSLTEHLKRTLTAEERRVVGLISFNQWTFTLSALIETALAVREIGSRVCIGFWANDTPMEDPGWTTWTPASRVLRSPAKDALAQRGLDAAGLDRSTFVRPPIKHWRAPRLPDLVNPLTRADIRALTYHGSDMGRSILQVHPRTDTPISEEFHWPRAWVRRAMESYAWVYDQVSELIRKQGITTLVVYNGRFTHDRAVAAAGHAAGIRVLYYDTGGYNTDFDVTEATTHDWAELQVRMRDMYAAWPDADRDEIASSWFENRQSHSDQSLLKFVEEQQIGHIDGVPDAEQLVVFFSSSGDEIAELDLDWSTFLNSQEEALAQLAAACRARAGCTLIVRTHPHMRLKPAQDLVDWTQAVELAAPDVHFDPYSPVDSYALMRKADVVFTYGSTAGIEAAYIGRPVVVMGPSAYDLLGCAQRITSAAELPSVLEAPPQGSRDKALPFGLMMQRRGFNYAYLAKHEGAEPTLSGVALDDASPLARKLSHARLRLKTWWLTR